MLIKTLIIFVLTFAISTSSLTNIVRDVFTVEAQATQLKTVEVEATAETETESMATEATYEEEETTVETTITTIPTEEILVEETTATDPTHVEETSAQEETQPVEEVTEATEETLPEIEETIAETQPEEIVKDKPYWEYYHYAPLEHNGEGYIEDGPAGPNGNDGYETWYDLDMTRIVEWLDVYFEQKGLEDGCDYSDYEYWVDERGVKMYGPYIIVAGDIVNTRQRYDIVECSLGTAIVADYCEEAVFHRPYQLDIATDWKHRKRVS